MPHIATESMIRIDILKFQLIYIVLRYIYQLDVFPRLSQAR
jgi:hypothetical protein